MVDDGFDGIGDDDCEAFTFGEATTIARDTIGPAPSAFIGPLPMHSPPAQEYSSVCGKSAGTRFNVG